MAAAKPHARLGDQAWAKTNKVVRASGYHVDLSSLRVATAALSSAGTILAAAACSLSVSQNAELFALTYGALVMQFIQDFEDVSAVNAQLDTM